ncbi:hypothetical protein Hanom_Chr09g00787821 [Helianthus anomalus]
MLKKQLPHLHRENLDGLAPPPPKEGLHLSPAGAAATAAPPLRNLGTYLPLPVVDSEGAAATAAPPLRNLGKYLPPPVVDSEGAVATAGAAAAGAAAPDPGRSEESRLVGASIGVPLKIASFLSLSLSFSSCSLFLCLSAISSSFALLSASSFLRLSASACTIVSIKHK